MLTDVVALLAGAVMAQAAAPPPNTVAPVTITPLAKTAPIAATVKVASDEESAGRDFVAIWPATAYSAGMSGRVILSCKIEVHGLAEWCRVASETPTGKGFGRAALQLRPTLKLEPAKGPDGQPISAVMNLSIRFTPPKREVVGTIGNTVPANAGDTKAVADSLRSVVGLPLTMRTVNMLDNPVWIEAAGFEDVARAYPGTGGRVEGYAAAHCLVGRSGAAAGKLSKCEIIKESPQDLGFGKAALSLTPAFRLMPASLEKIPRNHPLWVDIPIRLPPPAAQDRNVMAPVWLVGVDGRTTPRVFPPEATAGGVVSGKGVARCTVAVDGAMADCVAVRGEPDGLGFAEAAVKLAAGMKMNLWSADAAPVRGGLVSIPIRLNLKGATD